MARRRVLPPLLALGLLFASAQAGFQWNPLATGPTSVRTVAVDRSGIPWFGSHEGLHLYEEGRWKLAYGDTDLPSVPDGPKVIDLALDKEGRVWASTAGGQLKVFANRVLDPKPEYIPRFGVSLLEADPEGRIYAGPSEAGLALFARFDGISWKGIYSPPECADCVPNGIAFDTAGVHWIATKEGLFLYDAAGEWTHFAPNNSALPAKNLSSVATDRRGMVYMTHAMGLSVYDGATWKTYGKADFQGRRESLSKVKVDPKGRVWVTSGGSVGRDDTGWIGVYDGTWTFFPGSEVLPEVAFGDFDFSPDGKGWFATTSGACSFTETGTGISVHTLRAPPSRRTPSPVDPLGRPAHGPSVRLRAR